VTLRAKLVRIRIYPKQRRVRPQDRQREIAAKEGAVEGVQADGLVAGPPQPPYLRGDRHPGQSLFAPYLTAQREAVHNRHQHIGHDHVWPPAAGILQGLTPVGRQAHAKPGGLQRIGRPTRLRGAVVDQQHECARAG